MTSIWVCILLFIVLTWCSFSSVKIKGFACFLYWLQCTVFQEFTMLMKKLTVFLNHYILFDVFYFFITRFYFYSAVLYAIGNTVR